MFQYFYIILMNFIQYELAIIYKKDFGFDLS